MTEIWSYCLNYVYIYLHLGRLVEGDVIKVDCLFLDLLFAVIYCSILVDELYVEKQLLWCFKLFLLAFFMSLANPSHFYCWIQLWLQLDEQARTFEPFFSPFGHVFRMFLKAYSLLAVDPVLSIYVSINILFQI